MNFSTEAVCCAVLCLVAQLCPTLYGPMDCSLPGSSVQGDSPGKRLERLLCPGGFSRQKTGVGCHALLRGIFPIQASNPGLPHCRPVLCHLSHQGSALLQRRCATALRVQPSARGRHSHRRRRSCPAAGHSTGPSPSGQLSRRDR